MSQYVLLIGGCIVASVFPIGFIGWGYEHWKNREYILGALIALSGVGAGLIVFGVIDSIARSMP